MKQFTLFLTVLLVSIFAFSVMASSADAYQSATIKNVKGCIGSISDRDVLVVKSARATSITYFYQGQEYSTKKINQGVYAGYLPDSHKKKRDIYVIAHGKGGNDTAASTEQFSQFGCGFSA